MRWILLFLVGLATPVTAETKVPALQGLQSIFVIVGGLDEDSKKCGVSVEDVREAMWLPIRAYTKLKEGFAAMLSVQVITATNGRLCVHSLQMSVQAMVRARLAYQQSESMRFVELWRHSTVLSEGMTERGKGVRESVESMARKLASQWQADNP